MPLKLGDKVRSDRGLEGKIIMMDAVGHSAIIELHETHRLGISVTPIPLARLMWIEAYTPKPDRPV